MQEQLHHVAAEIEMLANIIIIETALATTERSNRAIAKEEVQQIVVRAKVDAAVTLKNIFL